MRRNRSFAPTLTALEGRMTLDATVVTLIGPVLAAPTIYSGSGDVGITPSPPARPDPNPPAPAPTPTINLTPPDGFLAGFGAGVVAALTGNP